MQIGKLSDLRVSWCFSGTAGSANHQPLLLWFSAQRQLMAPSGTFQRTAPHRSPKNLGQNTENTLTPGNVTFIVVTKDDGSRVERNSVGGIAKSAINSHIARLTHARRRQERAKQAQKVPSVSISRELLKPPLIGAMKAAQLNRSIAIHQR